MLQRGQSAGQYAQALRQILRDMNDTSSSGKKRTSAGSPSLAAMEEVLRLGQAIARHEQVQPPQATAAAGAGKSTPRQAPGGGLPRGPGSARGKNPADSAVRRGSADPYAFTDKVPPSSVRSGGQRRGNQHEAFRNSPEEMAIRAKIKVLELKERRLEREEHQKLQGGISFRKNNSSAPRSITPANDTSGASDDYGRNGPARTENAMNASAQRHSTPRRQAGGYGNTPGSIARTTAGAVPGQAPRHSTTKQPKMVFGHKL